MLSRTLDNFFGDVAQLAVQVLHTNKVVGSNPTFATFH